MFSKRRSVSSRRRGARGFTILELAVAMLISLFATLAIAKVVFDAEKQRRAATAGSDAQSNGAVALMLMRKAIMPAGYGYTQTPAALGCAVSASYKGAPIPGFPSVLAPVVITDGGSGGAPDRIRVVGSAKRTYSVPIRIADDYAPPQTEFKVAFTSGVQVHTGAHPGDLLLAVGDASSTCELFHVTGLSGTNRILRVDEADGWNAPGHPAQNYRDGDFLVNLGELTDLTFSIEKDTLAVRRFQLEKDGQPQYEGPEKLQSNVVNLQALYGKDTDGNGSIDRWDAVTPASNAEWLQVLAVRIAVVARSVQYDKEQVTQSNPLWNLGSAIAVPAEAVACGAARCLPLRVDHLTDWQHYRYKVFDTTIPLPNLLWRPA